MGDKVGVERAYGNLGIAYDTLGDFKKAIYYHELALKNAQQEGDKTSVGRVCGNLGITYQKMGDFNRAIYYHERCLTLCKAVGDKGGERDTYGNLGIAYDTLGDFKKAIYYHELALKNAQQEGDKTSVGKVCGNLGITYKKMGDFNRAIYYHERSIDIAKEVGDKATEEHAYGNLGSDFHSLGDFKTAIEYYERCLKFSKEVGDKVAEAAVYRSLGNGYNSLGNVEKAIDYHERCLKVAKEVGDKAQEGFAYGSLGIAYNDQGDSKRAIAFHNRCLTITKEVGDKAREGAAYGNLGNAHDKLGDFKTAIDCHERCLKIAKEVGSKDGEAFAYGNLGKAYSGLGDVKKAINYFENSLKIAEDLKHKVVAAASLSNLGRSFESEGSIPKAVDCFNSSVRMFNIIRHDLKGKDEWKISYRNMNEIAYTSLWRLLLKQGEIDKALFAADQGRAQALNDLMAVNYGLETTYCQLDTQEKRTFDSFSFLPSTAVFIAIDERDIVFWIVRNRKEVELRRKKPSDNCSLNLNGFLKSLLETASQEIGVRAGVKCEDRSLDKLGNKQVANGRSPQTPGMPVPLQMKALRLFYDVIIEPIADLAHADELILVPEGPLCLAPFAAFLDSNARYLCDVCRIRVIPSLTSLKQITDSQPGYHSRAGVLLVGDPWVQDIGIPGIMLEKLPCAREEVQMIGSIYNTEPLIGREATKDEVLRRLPTVALIHIAAHGRVETGEIALAPNTTRTSQIPAYEDFLLTMKDVKSAQIRARLVVLSCCHSGRGEPVKAEGVVGIARAFLGAGARAVLVSLWAIDDAATLEFMRSFYSHLVKGISASESLNKAMKHMRESDQFNEVKHWAPFVLIGDDVTLEFGGSK